MLSEQKFNEGMAILCELFGRDASKLLLKGYYLVLQKLSNEEFDSAIASVLNSHKFAKMPLPAEIMEQIRGNSQDAAVIALDKLEKAMRRHGKYRSVSFDDPVIMATVSSMGGWAKLCCMEQDEWKWARKEFEKIYKAFSTKPVDQLQIPNHLPGLVEITNSANGYVEKELQIEYVGKRTVPLLSA